MESLDLRMLLEDKGHNAKKSGREKERVTVLRTYLQYSLIYQNIASKDIRS